MKSRLRLLWVIRSISTCLILLSESNKSVSQSMWNSKLQHLPLNTYAFRVAGSVMPTSTHLSGFGTMTWLKSDCSLCRTSSVLEYMMISLVVPGKGRIPHSEELHCGELVVPLESPD